MNSGVDHYLLEGCGRCAYGGTPDCKVHRWKNELEYLRSLVLECGLEEEVKWSVPCYTFQGANVLIVSAFKDYAALSFFKGALLNDENNLLVQPGKSTQSARIIKFKNIREIVQNETTLKEYIFEALEVEKSGIQVKFKKNPEKMPMELLDKFDENPDLKHAFEALTPGRQRGYILHFSAPKQVKTRVSRIEKSIQKILHGKGFNE
jgi:uncharacterized protein YdeI (YjbR/CyaY-like superfamily)